jgi:outer membrane protein assembly factor BamA
MVEIDNIFITGNKRTKGYIILRELDIQQGERYNIADLREILKTDRNKVYNTSLFNTVDIGILDVSLEKVVVQVEVAERWYFYPIPKIDFVDRNFNDWWVNQNHDFSRLVFGIKLTDYNFRGRNERVQILLQAGYTDAVGVRYTIPYINKNQRTGLSFYINYGENTNTAFNTIDHRQGFVDSDQIIRTSLGTGFTVTRRKSFYNRHFISASFTNRWVGDTVISLNANYFNEGANRQRYFYLGYGYNSDHRDIVAYPLRGYNFEVSVAKVGLGIYDDVNKLSFRTFFSKYVELPKRFFVSNYSSIYVSFPETQPYANATGLGFGKDVIRGYELNVIEGKSYFINKSTFKKELFKKTTRIKAIPIEQFQSFPFAMYLKTYFDFGYVRNLEGFEQSSRLSDSMIYGGGVGLDIFTSYDLVMRFEYSVNSELEGGFFFHFKKEF